MREKTFTFRASLEELEQLRTLALFYDRTPSDFIRYMIRQMHKQDKDLIESNASSMRIQFRKIQGP